MTRPANHATPDLATPGRAESRLARPSLTSPRLANPWRAKLSVRRQTLPSRSSHGVPYRGCQAVEDLLARHHDASLERFVSVIVDAVVVLESTAPRAILEGCSVLELSGE